MVETSGTTSAANNTAGEARGQDGPLLRPKSRRRTILFVVIELALFVATNAFWYYMSVGRWFDFHPEAYTPDLTAPMSRITAQPLNIYSHPWVIIINGLLLGTMIWVPLTMSVLYRGVIAAVSVLFVALFGHAIVLSLVLAIGCIFAARTGLRREAPFLAIMLGVIPVGGYLYLCGYMAPAAGVVLPLQRWVKHAPLFIAVVSAILAAAATLSLVRITRYSPGVAWPCVVVMLGASLAVFYLKVGPDELDYALVTGSLGHAPSKAAGDRAAFWDEAFFKEVSKKTWIKNHDAEGLIDETLLNRIEDSLNERRKNLMEKCRRFLRKHPDSDRASQVLWLQAQCSSLQLDHQVYSGGLVKYVASYPLKDSFGYWRDLQRNYKGTPQAALALWRLGELTLRGKDDEIADRMTAVKRAYERLCRAMEHLQDLAPFDFVTPRSRNRSEVFVPAESLPGPAYYEHALFEVKRLVWLIENNDVLNDERSARAMEAYLDTNPYKPGYVSELEKHVSSYESSQMGDNLKLAAALATSDLYVRVGSLMMLAEARPPTDASIEANYELGQLAIRSTRNSVLRLASELKSPQEYFKVVIAAPDNPWQKRAAERLAWLQSRTQTQRRQD